MRELTGAEFKLKGRNTTGPPSCAAPGELRCICATAQCYR